MLDIEELFKNGKEQTFCPFYQQIEIAKSYSDIVFMPYNYIFDEDINKIMEFDIKNDILIIDEAHNIRKVCEDSKSIEIKSNDFDDIITDLNSLLTLDEDGDELDVSAVGGHEHCVGDNPCAAALALALRGDGEAHLAQLLTKLRAHERILAQFFEERLVVVPYRRVALGELLQPQGEVGRGINVTVH